MVESGAKEEISAPSVVHNAQDGQEGYPLHIEGFGWSKDIGMEFEVTLRLSSENETIVRPRLAQSMKLPPRFSVCVMARTFLMMKGVISCNVELVCRIGRYASKKIVY